MTQNYLTAGTLSTALASVLLAATLGMAQQRTPPPVTPPKAPVAAASQARKAPAPVRPAVSQDNRRRDPFHTLIPEKKPVEAPGQIRLPPGKRGLVIEQLDLQGIARGLDGGWIAVVDNKTKRAYFLHEKDQLYNGVVSKITADTVVFLESSSALPGNTTSREVVKRLSPQ